MKIQTHLIHELYATTGYGMLDCKKALQETDGDLIKAEAWLKQWRGGTTFATDNLTRPLVQPVLPQRND